MIPTFNVFLKWEILFGPSSDPEGFTCWLFLSWVPNLSQWHAEHLGLFWNSGIAGGWGLCQALFYCFHVTMAQGISVWLTSPSVPNKKWDKSGLQPCISKFILGIPLSATYICQRWDQSQYSMSDPPLSILASYSVFYFNQSSKITIECVDLYK